MESYKEYKTWLDGYNAQGAPQQTEQEKEAQLQSDLRVKGYVTQAVQGDNILSKMLGIGLISNGYIDPSLAQLFFIDRFLK